MTAPLTMQDRAKQAGLVAYGKVQAMSGATRIAAVVAALVVAVGGYVFMNWVGAPTYAPLFTNLAPADASAVVDKLDAAGVPYQLAANGTEILVPQEDVYKQRISLSASGLPASPQTGYSLLDNLGVTASEFQQHIDYQRALEGELGKTIQSIQGVTAASVHLAIPQQDVFNDGSQKATASVLLTLDRGVSLSSQQVTAIVNLVAASVPGLTTDNVTVTNSAGQVLSASGIVGGGTNDQAVTDYESRISQQVQHMLDTLVGPGKAVVTINADLDMTKTTTTSHTYTADPTAPPLAQSTTSETYTGNGAAAAGVAGTTASPAAPAGGTTSGGTYNKTTNTQNNAIGTVDTTVQSAPGAVKRLGIAIVLDDTVPASVTPSVISGLVSSAAGINTQRGDSINVQRLGFDHTAAQQAAAAQKDAAQAAAQAATQKTLVQLIAAGIGLAVVLIAAVVLFSRKRKRRRGLEGSALDLMPEEQPDPEPLVPNKSWSEMNLEASRKQLHDLATENPGDVAKVLRSWLTN